MENIEEMNAKRWEEDTDVSSVAPSRLPPGLGASAGPRLASRVGPPQVSTQGNSVNPTSYGNDARTPAQSNRGRGRGQTSSHAAGMATARELQASRRGKPAFNPGVRRGGGPSQASGYQGRPRISPEKSKSAAWADPPNLITTQRQRELESKALDKKIREEHLTPLEEGADPYGVAYIIWGKGSGSATDLLGDGLSSLNNIRIAYKVWIEWKGSLNAIKISSRSEVSHQQRVQQAIVAIRDVIAHAKAKVASFRPIYIAGIPTASAMRTLVLPKIIQPGRIARVELVGEPLTSDAKTKWKELRVDLVKDARKEFEDHLTKGLLALAPYKGWMRMRVHFGHIEFSRAHDSLRLGKCGFLDFKNMVGNPRMTGRFQRKLESAVIAENVKKRILAWSSRYKPVEGSVRSIEEVQFKDTEVIFVTVGGVGSNGQALRIEADIERIHTARKQDEYQMGTRRLFKDNETNKRLEITTIDIENRVDWAVEVITDNSIENWPEQLTSLIKGSVSTRTKVRKDKLGLEYPGVTPTAPFGVYVTKTVVRSVIQYKAKDSGYIVEIAIYRTWDGEKTSGEPEMASSVSLYHPYWDDEMESIESKATEVRQWDSSLSHFFVHGFQVEGIPALRDEIAVVQGFLSAAQLNVDQLIVDAAHAHAQRKNSDREEDSD